MPPYQQYPSSQSSRSDHGHRTSERAPSPMISILSAGANHQVVVVSWTAVPKLLTAHRRGPTLSGDTTRPRDVVSRLPEPNVSSGRYR